MRTLPIAVNSDHLSAFCRRHGVAELSLFGSILRDDFGRDSHVDILVTFEEGQTLTLDSCTEMSDELSQLFQGRHIDLVETACLADPYRRHTIMRTREPIYAEYHSPA